MLTIAYVVVVWHVFAALLEHKSVLHHFPVEAIDVLMRDCIFNDDESILVECPYGLLQVARSETTCGELISARLDGQRMCRSSPSTRNERETTRSESRGTRDGNVHCRELSILLRWFYLVRGLGTQVAVFIRMLFVPIVDGPQHERRWPCRLDMLFSDRCCGRSSRESARPLDWRPSAK